MGENPVIVNELLCFIANKLDVVDNDSLVQLCQKTFSNEDAVEAKTIMKTTCTSLDLLGGMRIVDRIGTDKLKRSIEDIVAMAHKLGDSGPTFVAKDLRKLPPVNFDNIDVTHLLWRLEKVELEVKSLKEVGDKTCNIVETMLKPDQPSPKGNSSSNDDRIKRLQSSTSLELTSKGQAPIPDRNQRNKDGAGPTGALTKNKNYSPPIPSVNSRNLTSLKSLSYRPNVQLRSDFTTSQPENTSLMETSQRTRPNDSSDMGALSYAETLRNGPGVWQLVTNRKKRKPKIISGSLTDTGDVKAAERTTDIFTSWWGKDSTCEGVQNFLKNKHGLSASCEDVLTRAQQYKCFKVSFMTKDDINLLDPNLWPKGVRIAKFFNRPKRRNNIQVDNSPTAGANQNHSETDLSGIVPEKNE